MGVATKFLVSYSSADASAGLGNWEGARYMSVRQFAAVTLSFVAIVASLVVPASAIFAGSASAGVNTHLCPYNDVRGPVSPDFVLDGCVDGTSIVVSNNHSYPVTISRTVADPNTGAALQGVGALQPITLSENTYDKVTRTTYASSGGGSGDLLLPGDVVRYPIGPNGGEIDVSQVSNNLLATYAAAELVSNLNTKLNTADAVRSWAAALLEGSREYNICLARPHASTTGCVEFATGVILSNAFVLLFNLGSGFFFRGIPNAIVSIGQFLQALTAEEFVFDEGVAYLSQGPLSQPCGSLGVICPPITQQLPEYGQTVPSLSGSFHDQLVTQGGSGAVTFDTTSASSGVSVSGSGYVTASPNLSAGTYLVSGTDSDNSLGKGYWEYNLTVFDESPCSTDCSLQLSLATLTDTSSPYIFINPTDPAACDLNCSVSLFAADSSGHLLSTSGGGFLVGSGCGGGQLTSYPESVLNISYLESSISYYYPGDSPDIFWGEVHPCETDASGGFVVTQPIGFTNSLSFP
jgi:hypothetical protein